MRRREFLKKAGAVLTALPLVGLLGWPKEPAESAETEPFRARFQGEETKPVRLTNDNIIIVKYWDDSERLWKRLELADRENFSVIQWIIDDTDWTESTEFWVTLPDQSHLLVRKTDDRRP